MTEFTTKPGTMRDPKGSGTAAELTPISRQGASVEGPVLSPFRAGGGASERPSVGHIVVIEGEPVTTSKTLEELRAVSGDRVRQRMITGVDGTPKPMLVVGEGTLPGDTLPDGRRVDIVLDSTNGELRLLPSEASAPSVEAKPSTDKRSERQLGRGTLQVVGGVLRRHSASSYHQHVRYATIKYSP